MSSPSRVVAVSPHLDDVAFSCGGTLLALGARGWRVEVVTVFTASTAPPLTPFALSTQLDKGLPADVDYLALRRAEDDEAMARLGVAPPGIHRLGLPEAPHRGYTSAPDLFAGAHPDDRLPGGAPGAVAAELAALLAPLCAGADLVLAPAALGNHVDHVHVAAAVAALPVRTASYRDTPYALRLADDGHDAGEYAVDVTPWLPAKLDACAAYATQLGFQFGGQAAMRAALTGFAAREAARLGVPVPAAEVLRGDRPKPDR